jgi:hypothetical protein
MWTPRRSRFNLTAGHQSAHVVGVTVASPRRLVTASEFARIMPDVSIHLVACWRNHGKITVCGKRGRSRLYDFDELCGVEAATRSSGYSHRRTDAA